MKQLNGVWLPDHEEHLKQYADLGPFGEWTYQRHKLDAALKFCKNRRKVAVDIGGHCGIWARELMKAFGWVHSFEPVPDHRNCYEANQHQDNYTLYPYALGKEDKRVSIQTSQGSSGDSWVVPGGDVQMKTLDFFDLAPDFVKIDCEGFELFILQGAEKTLRKHKPCIIVEQKPGHAGRFGLGDTDAVPYLESLGYVFRREIAGDYILS